VVKQRLEIAGKMNFLKKHLTKYIEKIDMPKLFNGNVSKDFAIEFRTVFDICR